ncbi:hypothetical protein KAX22_06815, partial [bacterium]|nr:hypothetical protein [bacterium]
RTPRSNRSIFRRGRSPCGEKEKLKFKPEVWVIRVIDNLLKASQEELAIADGSKKIYLSLLALVQDALSIQESLSLLTFSFAE